MSDTQQHLEMLFVKSDYGGGWTSQETLFKHRYQDAGNGSKLWSVPFNYGSEGYVNRLRIELVCNMLTHLLADATASGSQA